MPLRPSRPHRVLFDVRLWLVLALTLSTVGTSSRQARADAAALWQPDFARARAVAQASDRPLLIQFSGPYCPACIRLERETLPYPKVVALASGSLVAVKLRTDTSEALAVHYGITAIPTTIIATPRGEVLARNVGFLDGERFHDFLRVSISRYVRPSPAPVAAPAPAPALTGKEALEGYCPVSLVTNHRLTRGRAEFVAEHNGRIYRFADARARDLFRKQPELYLPVNGAHCAVSAVDRGEDRQGSPHHGALYQGHLYLFADASRQALFLKNPARYLRVDRADRAFCAHCWAQDGLAVRTLPPITNPRALEAPALVAQVDPEAVQVAAEAVQP